ncbi:MAG TPA: endonuclease/exonuclease/phosphatase family protein [Polyangiaceae bacterium]|nr:endonuclease/exonuclease/phosphatase family protein [Polyangiaceae bacterium]HMR75770.1 endonuclease/exonuclease/phosphatase family protein [Polyangiaceae bacterium]
MSTATKISASEMLQTGGCRVSVFGRTLLALSAVLVAACGSQDAETNLTDDGGSDASAAQADATAGQPDALQPLDSSLHDASGIDGGAGDGAAGDAVVTMVSFNLLHGFPSFTDLDKRTQMVIDYIKTQQPDIIAVQEVGRTPTLENRAKIIATAVGYHWDFEVASGVGFVFEEGPGVLSRWPISSRKPLQLPHVNGFEVRKALRVRIQSPFGGIDVTSTHLTTQDPENIKADQALAAHALTAQDRTGLAGFFAGDMNATPDSLAMRVLRGAATHAGKTGDLVDAWGAANPSDPGLTASSSALDRRIDYVYVVPGSKGPGEVLSCRHVLDKPNGGLFASDHIGVECRVRIN